jgi:pimeloyl-ACP methyl ester carboxylesterase
MPNYTVLDAPAIVNMIFFPRRDYSPSPEGAFDFSVPVAEGVDIISRFYAAGESQPVIIYFHGNGETIYDYDGVAPVYNSLGMNLAVADYRGYGNSGGEPTFSDVCQDARKILDAVRGEMSKRGFFGDLWLMGRSLGSMSALELAAACPEQVRGLIIESGFSNVARVMKQWGRLPVAAPLDHFDQECLDMVRGITMPVLILHGSADQVVPYREAVELHQNLGSAAKKLVTIVNAGHNDIRYVGMKQYFREIVEFVKP